VGESRGEGAQTVDNLTQKPPSNRWPQTLITHATLSSAKDAYVVDNIALPLDNPWKRNVRLADLAFFPDGRAAAVTFDGDVWMISGLRGELKEVLWRRFASGLHEPLGICVRGEDLFVFDRNGIWRLRDTDGNGEADVHELFANNFTQTAETREYAHAIKVAPDGSFIIAKAGIQFTTLGKHNGTVLRISPDGKSTTVLAHGLRSPYIGVHPKTGLVTASDQQGYYVPATPLHIIRDGQFYGFLPAILPKEKYPAPIADPLTWIPHSINASGAAQVWLTDARMGPLNDALIHLGYYRPEIFRVLLNQRLARTQAAVVSLTRNLEFAPLGAAVNPIDGQLYLTGFQIFGTTAKQLSGLARLRYTGAPSTLPREVVPMDKGILLRFDEVLEAKRATDPSSYSAERWNYVRTANYGSPHFKVDGTKGQDPMTPSSAYLSKDGRSVFVGIPDMKPVMQMRLAWALATRDGANFEQSAYFTPYELAYFDPATEGFESLSVDLTPRNRQLAAVATLVTADEGKRLSELMGCVACHSSDGSTIGKVGPTWKGLFGSLVAFADGSKTVANEAYLRESIREPSIKIVSGFEKSDTGMPSYEGVISEAQIESLILYIKTLR
jgi:cytochrome c2